MKKILLVIFIFLCSQQLLAQDCYSTARQLGIESYNKGKYAEANKHFTYALSTCSDTPENNDLNVWIKRCEGKMREASAPSRNNQNSLLTKANECFDKGDYECAKKNYEAYSRATGKNTSAEIKKIEECSKILLIANYLFENEDYEKAEKEYNKILALNAGNLYVAERLENITEMEEISQPQSTYKYGKYGYVDRYNKEVIPFIYDSGFDFYENMASVRKGGKYGFINTKGEQLIPFVYDLTIKFSEGLAWIRIDEKYGFIDETGKEIIPRIYDDASNFSEGMASVKKNGKYGFIDKTGREVIPCIYEEVSTFSEGMAGVKKDGNWGFIDIMGRIMVPLIYNDYLMHRCEFSENLVCLGKDGKYGYIDKTGKEIIPFIYDSASDFSEGLAGVKKDGKHGYIDKTGKEIIPLMYSFGTSFIKGYAKVRNGGAYYIDKMNNKITPEWAKKYDEHRILYDLEYSENEVTAAVRKDNKWGYINRKGILVIPLIYDEIYDVSTHASTGIAHVKKDGKWGSIKKNGIISVPIIYDDIRSLGYWTAAVKKGEKWGITGGEPHLIFDEIGYYNTIPHIPSFGIGGNASSIISAKKDGKWGFIHVNYNSNSRIAIPFNYDYVGTFDYQYQNPQAYATVKIGEKHGFINHLGVEVVPIQYNTYDEARKALEEYKKANP